MFEVRLAGLVFLSWPISVGLVWLIVFLPEPEGNKDRYLTRSERLAFALPPTLLLAPFLILLVASPVAQGNAGSELRMSLWSFRVDAWQPLLLLSGLLCLIYFIAIAVVICAGRRHLLEPAGFALASCGIACFILWHAFPSA